MLGGLCACLQCKALSMNSSLQPFNIEITDHWQWFRFWPSYPWMAKFQRTARILGYWQTEELERQLWKIPKHTWCLLSSLMLCHYCTCFRLMSCAREKIWSGMLPEFALWQTVPRVRAERTRGTTKDNDVSFSVCNIMSEPRSDHWSLQDPLLWSTWEFLNLMRCYLRVLVVDLQRRRT